MRSIVVVLAILAVLFLQGKFVLANNDSDQIDPNKRGGAAAVENQAEQKAEGTDKQKYLSGTIEAVDSAAGTLTVKGMNQSVSLKTGENVKLEGLRYGDKVRVEYSGDTAVSVMKPEAQVPEPAKPAADKKAEPPAKPMEK